MKSKHIAIVLCLISLLFLTSCTGSSSNRSRDDIEYRRGSQGIEIQFQPNSPPSTIYAEDLSFPVALEIRNRGVFPGEDDSETVEGQIHFLGFDRDIIRGLDTADSQFTFKQEDAVTRYNPEGGYDIVDINQVEIADDFFTSNKVDSYDANIFAVACYNYKTYANIDVCIDPNPSQASIQDTCNPGTTSGGSQGAPIAVTSVETIPQKEAARFVIEIANVGGGDVIRKNDKDDCVNVEYDREMWDKVNILSVKLAGQDITSECTPSNENNEIRLINGRATLICKIDLGGSVNMVAYESILSVELEYGYKTTAHRLLRILGE